MKVYIEIDEMYPVFFLETESRWNKKPVEISEEEYRAFKQAEQMYAEAQNKAMKLLKENR